MDSYGQKSPSRPQKIVIVALELLLIAGARESRRALGRAGDVRKSTGRGRLRIRCARRSPSPSKRELTSTTPTSRSSSTRSWSIAGPSSPSRIGRPVQWNRPRDADDPP